jgi:hypothetical protein
MFLLLEISWVCILGDLLPLFSFFGSKKTLCLMRCHGFVGLMQLNCPFLPAGLLGDLVLSRIFGTLDT